MAAELMVKHVLKSNEEPPRLISDSPNKFELAVETIILLPNVAR